MQKIEDDFGDLRSTKVPTRIFKLPISFESKLQDEATQRYMTNQRPHAPYLPDNLSFVAKNNAFTSQQLKDIYLTGKFMAVVVGFFCGNTVSLPVDPRQRMNAPKMNPSRVFTPEGTVGWAGSCMSIYPVDSPGGYQMTGRTVPCFDYYAQKPGFKNPWIFRDFDILTYYQVSEQELDDLLGRFRAGKFTFEYEDVEFDMADHNKMLQDSAEEVKEIRMKQAEAQEEMTKAENESFARWQKEKAESQVDESTVEKLLDDPSIIPVEAPVDANVWRVEVKEGDTVEKECAVSTRQGLSEKIANHIDRDPRGHEVRDCSENTRSGCSRQHQTTGREAARQTWRHRDSWWIPRTSEEGVGSLCVSEMLYHSLSWLLGISHDRNYVALKTGLINRISNSKHQSNLQTTRCRRQLWSFPRDPVAQTRLQRSKILMDDQSQPQHWLIFVTSACNQSAASSYGCRYNMWH